MEIREVWLIALFVWAISTMGGFVSGLLYSRLMDAAIDNDN